MIPAWLISLHSNHCTLQFIILMFLAWYMNLSSITLCCNSLLGIMSGPCLVNESMLQLILLLSGIMSGPCLVNESMLQLILLMSGIMSGPCLVNESMLQLILLMSGIMSGPCLVNESIFSSLRCILFILCYGYRGGCFFVCVF